MQRETHRRWGVILKQWGIGEWFGRLFFQLKPLLENSGIDGKLIEVTGDEWERGTFSANEACKSRVSVSPWVELGLQFSGSLQFKFSENFARGDEPEDLSSLSIELWRFPYQQRMQYSNVFHPTYIYLTFILKFFENFAIIKL